MAEGRRVAVFVNEFGSVDIDGDLIRWKGQIDEARRGTSQKCMVMVDAKVRHVEKTGVTCFS